MKRYLLGLLLAVRLAAQPAPAPDGPTADGDFAAFSALLDEKPPAPRREMGLEKYSTWLDGQARRLIGAGLAFYAAHPDDVRRWQVVLALGNLQPVFARKFGPDLEQKGEAVINVDEAAKAAWGRQLEKLQQELLDSSDAPAHAREKIEWGRFDRDFGAVLRAGARGGPGALAAFRPRFDAHVAKYAALDVVAIRATVYLGTLERNLPGASEPVWRRLCEAPNAALREKAASQMQYFERMRQPLDIAFTAVDGRAVDLKTLRGRVVLVDFWATWCGPCIAELPNVKRVYAVYHDLGFEVVGITLEDGRLLPQDTPGQTAAKLDAAKRVLTDFTARNGMPWPQYFDGKCWKNAISTQYDIRGIPAMFLIDQEGRVVTTNARGARLEQEVKRLLKL